MTSKRALRRQQRQWAKSAGLQPDSHGYLATIEQNLRSPLSATALAAFKRGSGSELADTAKRPAKMRALHSSAALVVNIFDYWPERDARPLLQALGLNSTLTALDLEQQFPTRLAGTAPNVDVTLTLGNGDLIAIESKFTEWLTPKPKNKPAFKAKYFEAGADLWTDVGLPDCQTLARNLYEGTMHYRSLDAAQLLKHALGLATRHSRNFLLYYLYYDLPSNRSAQHREEISEFSDALDPALGFKAVTYQELFSSLKTRNDIEPSYIAYLQSRYF